MSNGSGASSRNRTEIVPHVLQWEVPLSQFFVNQRVYLPKPAIWSPIATIATDRLLLHWQLSLEQGQTDAEIFVHHIGTQHIPNQGYQYHVFALNRNGESKPLTADHRASLNMLAGSRFIRQMAAPGQTPYDAFLKSNTKSKKSFTKQQSAAADSDMNMSASVTAAERLIWPGDVVKIRVILGLRNDVWSPFRILNENIAALEAEELQRGPPGTIGEGLWQQVRPLTPAGTVPATSDLVFVCPTGERMVAHKAVLAGFSQPILDEVHIGPCGQLTVYLTGIGPQALFEMLHFVYLRQLSPAFDSAPLNEILEAARIFNLPPLVYRKVEKLLAQILDGTNWQRILALAEIYGLKIVENLARKCERDSEEWDVAGLRPKMIITEEERRSDALCVEIGAG